MRNLKLALRADNFAAASVVSEKSGVKLKVDPGVIWNRAGLKQLSAALAGVAAMLPE